MLFFLDDAPPLSFGASAYAILLLDANNTPADAPVIQLSTNAVVLREEARRADVTRENDLRWRWLLPILSANDDDTGDGAPRELTLLLLRRTPFLALVTPRVMDREGLRPLEVAVAA